MECRGIGYEEGHRRTTGCMVGRERRWRVYLRSLCVSQMATGGRAASLCKAVTGVDRKALRILHRAAFCCSCRVVSRFFCPCHQISAPKSDLEVTHILGRLIALRREIDLFRVTQGCVIR
jgi:hypothetical protein